MNLHTCKQSQSPIFLAFVQILRFVLLYVLFDTLGGHLQCMQDILEEEVEVKEKRLSKPIFPLFKDSKCIQLLITFLEVPFRFFVRIQQRISFFCTTLCCTFCKRSLVYIRYIRVHKDATANTVLKTGKKYLI